MPDRVLVASAMTGIRAAQAPSFRAGLAALSRRLCSRGKVAVTCCSACVVL